MKPPTAHPSTEPTENKVQAARPQHTAGPLLVTDEGSQIVIQTFAEHPTGTIARMYRTDALAIADSDRLRACWNACQGIPDPTTAIPALVAALERALHIEEARLEDRRRDLFEDDMQNDAEYCAILGNRDAYRSALALVQGGKR